MASSGRSGLGFYTRHVGLEKTMPAALTAQVLSGLSIITGQYFESLF